MPSLLAGAAAVRKRQQGGWRVVQDAHEPRRAFRRVLEEVVGSVRDLRLPPWSTGAPSATGLMVGQLLFQAGSDGLVRQYLPGVDLGESRANLHPPA